MIETHRLIIVIFFSYSLTDEFNISLITFIVKWQYMVNCSALLHKSVRFTGLTNTVFKIKHNKLMNAFKHFSQL